MMNIRKKQREAKYQVTFRTYPLLSARLTDIRI